MDPADNSQGGDDGSSGSGYAINGEIMMAAIAVLFTVILFIVCLHVYAKWFWRQSGRVIIYRRRGRRRGSWSLRRFVFVGAEDGGDSEDRGCVGLDKAVIESLPVFVYQSGRYEEGLDCAVCLCEFEDNEKGRLLPTCNHSFHVDCIEMWLLSHSTCPLCRSRVQADEGFLRPPGNAAEEFGGGDDVSAVEAAVDSNCEETGENSGSPQQEEGEPSSESAKFSVNRLRSLKKLLARENRVFPSDPDVGDIEQGGQPLSQQ